MAEEQRKLEIDWAKKVILELDSNIKKPDKLFEYMIRNLDFFIKVHLDAADALITRYSINTNDDPAILLGLSYIVDVLADWPGNDMAWAMQGEAFARMGREDDSINSLARALNLNINNAKALAWSGQINYKYEDYDSALQYCKAAFDLDPHDTGNQLLLIGIYKLKKMEREANDLMRKRPFLDTSLVEVRIFIKMEDALRFALIGQKRAALKIIEGVELLVSNIGKIKTQGPIPSKSMIAKTKQNIENESIWDNPAWDKFRFSKT